MSMNTAADPSAPLRSPSSTSTSKVKRSPSRLGDFNTTTASFTPDPSLVKAETVAFGGSLAKLSLPFAQSSTMCLVRSCPADTHRSISKDDGVLRDAIQNQLVALQSGFPCIENDERRHDFRFGLANRLLQRNMRRHLGRRLSKPKLSSAEHTGDGDHHR